VTTDDTIAELESWLEANWDPELTLREWWSRLAASGWSQAHWPAEWHGRGLSDADSAAVSRAIARFGAVPGPVGFGTGMAGPVALAHGTDDQRRRHLPGIVDGSDAWCQLFSEPNAGSDLAGLQCRAERDGDEWVINGQKVWTSGGQIANKAMIVARTDFNVPKHPGLSYFFIDVRQPGVEIRPLREMTGRAYFNEVFLTDARVPGDDLIGGEGNGWAVANTTLAFERALSGGGRAAPAASPGEIAGHLDRRAGDFVGSTAVDAAEQSESRAERFIRLAQEMGCSDDPVVRDRLVRMHTLETVRTLTSERARALARSGSELAGVPNLAKMAQNHEHRMARALTFELLGASGMLFGYDSSELAALDEDTPVHDHSALVEGAIFATAPPIYGGSDQIQRNIIGERILGLAREPNVEKGVPFRDLPKN
jgi:alkylation response protein AidB-like acyl-CoA dehydrogenase